MYSQNRNGLTDLENNLWLPGQGAEGEGKYS